MFHFEIGNQECVLHLGEKLAWGPIHKSTMSKRKTQMQSKVGCYVKCDTPTHELAQSKICNS